MFIIRVARRPKVTCSEEVILIHVLDLKIDGR